MIVLLVGFAPLLFAGTNALIEVKLFKAWVIESEWPCGNLAIMNTGTEPFLLAKEAVDFSIGQLATRSLDNSITAQIAGGSYELNYREITLSGEGFDILPVGEKKVYEGKSFLFPSCVPFSETMRFKVSVYLGNGIIIDSKPLIINGVIADSEEFLASITNNKLVRQGKTHGAKWDMVTITYKKERWLYKKSPQKKLYSAICPISLNNKIRVEPYDDALLFRIWDGDKSMLFHMSKSIIVEGPDENDVLGKWTREKKKEIQVHNDSVRHKKSLKVD